MSLFTGLVLVLRYSISLIYLYKFKINLELCDFIGCLDYLGLL